jgi:tRNA pseudouridine55 synthase
MGHGGTLDPLASGVLIIGIGRGTKDLSRFLGGRKTYETVVVFGWETDTYDIEGRVVGEADYVHVTKELVQSRLEQFRGTIKQTPPVYSALKIDGKKAHEYIRASLPLPRELEAREVCVESCELLEWMEPGTHTYQHPHQHSTTDPTTNLTPTPKSGPAARIKLTVSSGFYVRSFCHDLGLACSTLATMASLVRTQQSVYTLEEPEEGSGLVRAVGWGDVLAGEEVWGEMVRRVLERWMEVNPVGGGRKTRRDRDMESRDGEKGGGEIVRQRFRGEWLAGTRKERIKQQGGKWKGKYNQPKSEREGKALEDGKEKD